MYIVSSAEYYQKHIGRLEESLVKIVKVFLTKKKIKIDKMGKNGIKIFLNMQSKG